MLNVCCLDLLPQRELREEAGIEALDASKRGVLLFDFVDAYAPPLAVHVFKATRFSGEPVERCARERGGARAALASRSSRNPAQRGNAAAVVSRCGCAL